MAFSQFGGAVGEWDRGGQAQVHLLVEVDDEHLVVRIAGRTKAWAAAVTSGILCRMLVLWSTISPTVTGTIFVPEEPDGCGTPSS